MTFMLRLGASFLFITSDGAKPMIVTANGEVEEKALGQLAVPKGRRAVMNGETLNI